MRGSPIQWCDDTVNPVAGCDGCELWPPPAKLREGLVLLLHEKGFRSPVFEQAVNEALQGLIFSTDIYKNRHAVAEVIARACAVAGTEFANEVRAKIEALVPCYAGRMNARYGGHSKGYPVVFEQPTKFPGRMVQAAKAKDLSGTDRPDKPWLNQLPRLIFISDMGDALSRSIDFDYFKCEIIEVVQSTHGKQHTWLWLTKQPGRMARFEKWLAEEGIAWPDNLVAMTSITSQDTIGRVRRLISVRAKFKGLSVEPLRTNVTFPLNGIDWVIVGGESGPHPHVFHVEWARDLRDQCFRAGVAFFVKQLGANAIQAGQPLKLKDSHGGDWAEFPVDLKIRRFPNGFYRRPWQHQAHSVAVNEGTSVIPSQTS